MTMEEQLKALILKRYKSIRAFTMAIDIPYSTVDTMLKKGIAGTGVGTFLKVCSALNIDVESFSQGTLTEKTPSVNESQQEREKPPVNQQEALESELSELTFDELKDLHSYVRFLKTKREEL